MIKEELMNLPHLAIAEMDDVKLHIHTEDGYIITNYTDDMDIKEYNGSDCYYFPLKFETYDEYRVITVEQANVYENAKNTAIEEENNKEENVE